jgi:SAM-dependent methyltransferase
LRTRTLETMQTPFNTMEVVQVGERVDMDVAGATYATWHPEHLLTGYSWDALSVGCLLRAAGPPASVLLLGLGGGTVARQLRHFLPGVRIVGIEIDQGVVDLARRHLHLDEAVEVHVADAYDWLASATETFDAVIDDLFLTGATDVVRSRVPEGDTLALVRRRVAPGGVVVANLITDVGDHNTVRRKTRSAFRDAFASVRVVKPPRGLNEILVGGDGVKTGKVLKRHATGLVEEDQRFLDMIVVSPL